MKIKYKIGIGNLSIILIFFIGTIITFLKIRTMVQNQIHQELQKLNNNVASMAKIAVSSAYKNFLYGILNGRINQLKEPLKNILELNLNSQKKDSTAQQFISGNPTKNGFFEIYDMQGNILFHSKSNPLKKTALFKARIQDKNNLDPEYILYDVNNEKWAAYLIFNSSLNWIFAVKAPLKDLKSLINPDDFKDSVSSIRIGKTGFAYIFDTNGRVVVHKFFGKGENLGIMKNNKGQFIFKKMIEKKNGKLYFDWKESGKYMLARKKLAYFQTLKDLNWIVVTSSYLEEVTEEQNKLRFVMAMVLLVSIAAALILAFLTIHSITSPIAKIRLMMKDVSEGEGDLTKKLKIKSNDEIQELAEFFNRFVEKLRDIIHNLQAHMRHLTNFSNELASNANESAASVLEITATLNSVVNSVEQEKDMVNESTDSMQGIYSDIKEIHKNSEDSQKQTKASSQIIEKMANNINKISKVAEDADSAAKTLTDIASSGSKSMQVLMESVQKVHSNSQKITQILKLIMNISAQTNLLAMNASIEASHAGELGKGFAVVAGEIRSLADKSAKGAKQIQEVVNEIATDIKKNLENTVKTEENFKVLTENISTVRNINHKIASFMYEQKESNHLILDAMLQLQNYSERALLSTDSASEKGHRVTKDLEALNNLAGEISFAMQEQKKALSEASVSSEHISEISEELKDIAEDIQQDFEKFKT